MRNLLMNWAVRLAMKKPAPNRIPTSGIERMRKRNYATVHLDADTPHPSFLVTSVEPDGYRGLWFAARYEEPTTYKVLNSEIHRYNLLITYYFHELELRYNSAFGYLLARAILRPSHQLFTERLLNWLFNKKVLARQDRMKVLDYIFEQTVANADFQTTFADLPVRLYGNRFYSRTDHETLLSYYKMILRVRTHNQ